MLSQQCFAQLIAECYFRVLVKYYELPMVSKNSIEKSVIQSQLVV